MTKIKRGTAFFLVIAGILLIAALGPQLGLFSSYGQYYYSSIYPSQCLIGESKCCDYSNVYCSDSGGNIQFKCEIVNYQNGTFYKNHWVGYGETSNCHSNILTRSYYRLVENECKYVYLKISEKTSDDYETSTECRTHINHNTLGLDNEIGDYMCSCTTGKESCANFIYFTCENSQWINKGQVNGKCGYSYEGTASYPCKGLIGEAYSICLHGTSNYINPDKTCDYYTGGNGEDEEETEEQDDFLDDTFITIGDFEVKVWMAGGAIALILLLLLLL